MLVEYCRGMRRGFRRHPVMSSLAMVAMGLGIGASMTMLTVWHVLNGDPLPARSGRLFYPHLDPLPINYRPSPDQLDPSANLTWPDAMALLKAARGQRQAAMAGGSVLMQPQGAGLQPSHVDARYVTRDFFAMFGLRMVQGGAWNAADDEAGADVVVLPTSVARQWFGTSAVVGRSLHLNHHEYRIVGVTADWAPEPKFYADASSSRFNAPDRLYLPLATAMVRHLDTEGNLSSWGRSYTGDRTVGTASWLQFWVELDTPAAVADYRRFLRGYAQQQYALGRFQRSPENTRLDSLMDHLRRMGRVPDDVRLQLALALAFQGVCLLNITALLLAMYLRRSGEVSIRRALGATRRAIFSQLAVEATGLGVCGGVLGLLLAQLGLWAIRQRGDDYAALVRSDAWTLGCTVLLAVGCSLLAALVPAWRACAAPPALQLKAQ